ncbi:hypothetical protein F4803DRAFT_539651 [Xylaria telfairii]|nr:hypothetical protein F4803DRAFT_539651 [Xylaria telfairii]
MSALATPQMSVIDTPNPASTSGTSYNVASSLLPAKQRCRESLKRFKFSSKRSLHSLRQRTKTFSQTSHPKNSSEIPTKPVVIFGGIASDSSTVPDFSELDGVELGDLNGGCGCLEGVGVAVKFVASGICCIICGSLACVSLVLGTVACCMCCPLRATVRLARED